jgi:transcriptional regulator with XRE-family HTH domain
MEAPGATLQDGIAQQADFVAELVRQRMLARLSQAALGALMGYDRTYVNKIERGALEPTAEFARKADASLHLSGDLFGRWESFNASKRQQAAQSPRPARKPVEEAATDLVITQDEAWLRFDGDAYGLLIESGSSMWGMPLSPASSSASRLIGSRMTPAVPTITTAGIP